MEPERIFDYDVYDNEGQKIGGVENCWVNDRTDALEFIGVKTGWLSGSNHVVPASAVQVDENERRIRLPFSKSRVKDAPTFKPKHDLTAADEAKVHAYYGEARQGRGTDLDRERERDVSPEGAWAQGPERDRDRDRATARDQDAVEMPLSEEEVDVEKRRVPSEGVRLRKVVRTEHKEIPVELEHEEVHVERVPPQELHDTDARDIGEEDRVLETTREEPVVRKERHVTGGVRAYKTRESEERTVEEDVRRETAEVDREPAGAGPRRDVRDDRY